jgi:hypothetical protein
MRYLVCVDDTDDLTKEISTGKVAQMIIEAATVLGATALEGITRHQLLLHDDIPYTSHNSSMCIELELPESLIDPLIITAEDIVRNHCSKQSDPGLCFCRPDQLQNGNALIEFGLSAQSVVIAKEEAYALAESAGGTILREYGGTGQGIIGALAGVGLRLSGCDGTFRGTSVKDRENQELTVAQWKELTGATQVITLEGECLADDDLVHMREKMKLAWRSHQKTIVVSREGNQWIACDKQKLMGSQERIYPSLGTCQLFAWDNDPEECFEECGETCVNCLSRRWTSDGLICQNEKAQIEA